jgi:hypothetical protein
VGKLVCNGAKLQCSMGAAPAVLIVVNPKVTAQTQPVGTIMDHKPTVNVPPFGMCNAKANPAVISATAAAMGTPPPAPCVPNTTLPWTQGCTKLKIQSQAVIHDSSQLNCLWGGVISVKDAGQTKVTGT